jgi:uncharacterized OsmC-like protein
VFRTSSSSENDSFAVRSQIRGFTTTIDEPLELGGTDSGPNPVELLLAALGGCQEIVYRAYAAVMGLEIERIEVHAKGYLDLCGSRFQLESRQEEDSTRSRIACFNR